MRRIISVLKLKKYISSVKGNIFFLQNQKGSNRNIKKVYGEKKNLLLKNSIKFITKYRGEWSLLEIN